MLRLKPTYEEMLRETRTRRLRILPERERRTQQGMLLDEVDFDDFDLGKYNKKIIMTNENPQKGTQTDLFSDHSSYSSTSESLKTAIEPDKEEQQVESEHSMQSSKSSSKSSEKSEEQEQEQQKSLMRRLFDSLFEEVEVEMPISRQTSNDSGARGSNEPMPTKKDETPIQSSSSSSSSSNSRSVLLPVESAPISVNSSRSPTIEYVDEEDLPVNVSSSSSNRTVQYVSSRSSRSSRPITISSGSR